jgi:feruloyl esterase
VFSVMLGTVGATLSAQNGSQFTKWKPTALADAAQVKPRDTCASLVALTGYDFSVTVAAIVPASAAAPEHCRVSGQIQPEVRFEVSLPATWNGRLYMFGNGGYAGEALDAPARITTTQAALSRGFASLR